uniref:tRNA(Ile)-lysidine synthase n=1 Tax=Lithothamnion corallioides TaxID=1277934 RepID=UPI0023EFC3EE|nr:tRNA(Ile)-lysidine synthase [Lithothamnion corallioides]WEA77105.1 tRNA(Ile)-lysidine synthase [Lithothamnion corallioides]
MYTFLHKKFKLSLIKLLKKNERSLIAISGGQDSLCLVKLIHECFKKYKYKFEAIYIDHQWKKDSLKHSQHIVNIIHQIDIPISIYQIKDLVFSEAEARAIRYQILIQHALQNNFTNIITGHNQNDQTETLIQNLIRGSSLDGITGLTAKRKINYSLSIIRPLLNFNREEIGWFCRKFCLPIWSDTSNYNYKIQRNRLRYELLPYLQKYFNPNINKSINNFLYLSIRENEYIRENSIKLYIKSKHDQLVSLNLGIIKNQHYALQKRTLQMYFHYHFNKNIKTSSLEKIISIINQEKIPSLIIYSDNLIIQEQNGWLYTNFKNRINS